MSFFIFTFNNTKYQRKCKKLQVLLWLLRGLPC